VGALPAFRTVAFEHVVRPVVFWGFSGGVFLSPLGGREREMDVIFERVRSSMCTRRR
jgi:hypothetical protein